jgi:hypothetical protein
MNSDLQTDYAFDADEPPSEAVVAALASDAGVDPTTMEPLYQRIDLEALDAIVAPLVAEQRQSSDVSVEFTVDSRRVEVTPGRVRIYADESSRRKTTAGIGNR